LTVDVLGPDAAAALVGVSVGFDGPAVDPTWREWLVAGAVNDPPVGFGVAFLGCLRVI
jgi:hypothetical protein